MAGSIKKWHKLKDKKPKLGQVTLVKYKAEGTSFRFVYYPTTEHEAKRSSVRRFCGEDARHIKWRKF
jgi:hypothetical protein